MHHGRGHVGPMRSWRGARDPAVQGPVGRRAAVSGNMVSTPIHGRMSCVFGIGNR